jgi:hypothetical protein
LIHGNCYILWTREATHLSITSRTLPYLSGWKVGRLFNHICTTTSRARALIRGTGQNAPVRQNEDVFGLETLGQRDGGLPVGGVGAGGRENGGLPQNAAEEAGRFADQQAGPTPLVD